MGINLCIKGDQLVSFLFSKLQRHCQVWLALICLRPRAFTALGDGGFCKHPQLCPSRECDILRPTEWSWIVRTKERVLEGYQLDGLPGCGEHVGYVRCTDKAIKATWKTSSRNMWHHSHGGHLVLSNLIKTWLPRKFEIRLRSILCLKKSYWEWFWSCYNSHFWTMGFEALKNRKTSSWIWWTARLSVNSPPSVFASVILYWTLNYKLFPKIEKSQ